MKNSISTYAVAIDNLLFDKIMDFEKKQLVWIKKIHDQSTIDHFDICRIMKIIQRFFNWPEMKTRIDRYIQDCHFCQRAKIFKNEYHDKLMSISIVNRSWKNISLDFVTNLVESENINEKSYNTILMIVCKMSKMRYLISCFVDDEDTSIWKTIYFICKLVFREIND